MVLFHLTCLLVFTHSWEVATRVEKQKKQTVSNKINGVPIWQLSRRQRIVCVQFVYVVQIEGVLVLRMLPT